MAVRINKQVTHDEKGKGDTMLREIVIALLFVLVVTPAYAVGNTARARDFDDPSKYFVHVEVPDILRDQIVERASEFASKVYRGVDAEKLREDLLKSFPDGTLVVEVIVGLGPRVTIPAGSQGIRFGLAFPYLAQMHTGAFENPPKARKPINALNLSEARAKRASEIVLSWLVSDAEERSEYKLKRWAKIRKRPRYGARWVLDSSSEHEGGGTEIGMGIDTESGRVTGVSIRRAFKKPKISYDDIVSKAEKEIPNFKAKHLSLTVKHHFADRRIVWRYADVRPTYIKNETWWDANTGELLYSRVLNVEEPGKEYMNPNFYSYPKEDEAKVMVEELIKKRAEELEKLKAK